MDSNKEYLRGIMNGKKKFLYCKNILVVKLPQIKSLSIKEILTFGKNNTNIKEYLPAYNYNKLPNREWLWNMINSITETKFKNFVNSAMLNREKEMIIRKDLNVSAIPEIVKIFKTSNNVSYTNGRTHFLMRTKNFLRKRKYFEMEVDGVEETKQINNSLQEKIKQLEAKIDDYKKNEDLFLQDKEKLVKLYEMGKIDSDGEPVDDDSIYLIILLLRINNPINLN